MVSEVLVTMHYRLGATLLVPHDNSWTNYFAKMLYQAVTIAFPIVLILAYSMGECWL